MRRNLRDGSNCDKLGFGVKLARKPPLMAVLSRRLGELLPSLNLPEDVTLTVDVDPVSLA
jgi:hypothetical protein